MDAYYVMGLGPGAPREEVKRRYHELAKQYHPDKVPFSRRAWAEERMKEINLAYKALSGEKEDALVKIRALVKMGQLAQAEALLPQAEKCAEYFYLAGVICEKTGRLPRAGRLFQTAAQMEPENAVYRRAVRETVPTLQEQARPPAQENGYEAASRWAAPPRAQAPKRKRESEKGKKSRRFSYISELWP